MSRIVRLASTPSTMAEAASLAAAGEPHGTVVVAERQTAGVGRHGHTWSSEDLGGLYLSMVLRVALPMDQMPVLTMALGLAVQDAVNELAQVSADLRWPNDVLLNERKLAGILVQSAGDAVIAGVGLNVNQRAFPVELRGIATSLLLETGREHSKAALLDRLRVNMLAHAQVLVERGKREIFRWFTDRSSYVAGKHVTVDMDGGIVRGITAGLDEHGFLRLSTESGMKTVIAGGVREA